MKKSSKKSAPSPPPKPAAPIMSLRAWFESTLPQGMTKSAYAKLLSEKSGGKIAMSTMLNLLKGQRLTSYAKGKAVSDLTGGKVQLTEILDG